MEVFSYLHKYLIEHGHYERTLWGIRFFSDQESDFWDNLEKRWRESSPKLSKYEANRVFFPKAHAIRKASGRVDAQEVKDRVDMLALYQMYFPEKREPKGNGKYRQVSCGLHGEDKMASMSLDVEFKRYNCFACLEKGDCFDFIQKVEGVGFREALELLNRM